MGINDTSGIKLRVLLSKQAVEFNNFVKESRHLFKQTFASPANERSIMKNIPITMLDDFKLVFGNAYRFAYRGSSKAGYTRPQFSYTRIWQILLQCTTYLVQEMGKITRFKSIIIIARR